MKAGGPDRTARKGCIQCSREFTADLKVCPHDGTILTPFGEDDLVGTVLADRYEILEVIGGGGMGLVYKARHRLMNRIVAIKMLHKHMVSSADALKRFQVEAQAASCLSLPNILTIYDFGLTDEGQPYMVMDYLEGCSLGDVIEEEGYIPALRAVNIFTQVCAGLSHAHMKGIIHRDLKPSNIMLVTFGEQKDFVKIVDFGIAKLMRQNDGHGEQLTRTGEVFGSPLYMSPEQCKGKQLDARSDIYALGSVMYRTLTGCPLFEGDEVIEFLFKQVSEMPQPFRAMSPGLRIPKKLEDIVFKALAKEPENRWQSMAQLKEALDQVKGELVEQDLSEGKPSTLTPGKFIADLSSSFKRAIGPESRPTAGPNQQFGAPQQVAQSPQWPAPNTPPSSFPPNSFQGPPPAAAAFGPTGTAAVPIVPSGQASYPPSSNMPRPESQSGSLPPTTTGYPGGGPAYVQPPAMPGLPVPAPPVVNRPGYQTPPSGVNRAIHQTPVPEVPGSVNRPAYQTPPGGVQQPVRQKPQGASRLNQPYNAPPSDYESEDSEPRRAKNPGEYTFAHLRDSSPGPLQNKKMLVVIGTAVIVFFSGSMLALNLINSQSKGDATGQNQGLKAPAAPSSVKENVVPTDAKFGAASPADGLPGKPQSSSAVTSEPGLLKSVVPIKEPHINRSEVAKESKPELIKPELVKKDPTRREPTKNEPAPLKQAPKQVSEEQSVETKPKHNPPKKHRRASRPSEATAQQSQTPAPAAGQGPEHRRAYSMYGY